MPRLILLDNQPSGFSSLALGAAEGLGQGMLQQEQRRNALADRRAIMEAQFAQQDNLAQMRAREAATAEGRREQFATSRATTAFDRSKELARVRADLTANAKSAEDADKAARARTVAQALMVESGTPPTLTPEMDPSGGGMPHGYLPGKAGPRWTDPADPEAVARVRLSREEAAARATERGIDNKRADANLALHQQQVDIAREKLDKLSSSANLTPEQQNEVRAALVTLNTRGSSPEEHAQAFMIARKYKLAPEAAAIQSTEKPQDTAEARVMRGRIEDLRSQHRAALANDARWGDNNAPAIQDKIDAMEQEYVRKFGAAATQPARQGAGSSIDEMLRQEMESVSRLEEQLRQLKGSRRP